jgi:hypothetical protein
MHAYAGVYCDTRTWPAANQTRTRPKPQSLHRPAPQVGEKVRAPEILLDEEPLDPPAPLTILLHKPTGYVVTSPDDERVLDPVVYDLLPHRWAAVGGCWQQQQGVSSSSCIAPSPSNDLATNRLQLHIPPTPQVWPPPPVPQLRRAPGQGHQRPAAADGRRAAAAPHQVAVET